MPYKRKYLVCRADKLGGQYKSSGDYLPKVVEAFDENDALATVLESYSESYRPMNRPFLVVPLHNAVVITLKPVNQYNMEVQPYGRQD